MKATPADIGRVASLVHQLCGVVVDSDKGYLVETRLASLLAEQGCKSYQELCDRVRSGSEGGLGKKVVDRMTTNETRFFRDGHPFDALQHKLIPESLDRANSVGGMVKILSAACSTGQEAVSVGVVVRELLGTDSKSKVQIDGVDVAEVAVEKARRGLYSEFEVLRCDRPDSLEPWLLKHPKGYEVDPRIGELLRFEQGNLLEHSTNLGQYDVILCRNVAIYFDEPTRVALIKDLWKGIRAGGALVVGSYEEIPTEGIPFRKEEHCGTVVYRKE